MLIFHSHSHLSNMALKSNDMWWKMKMVGWNIYGYVGSLSSSTCEYNCEVPFEGPEWKCAGCWRGAQTDHIWHITIMFQIKHVSDICAVALNPRNVWTVYSPHGDISWSPLESTPARNVPSLTFVLYVYFSSQIFLIEHIFIAWFFLLCWCWRRWRRKQEHFHEPS